MKDYFAVRLRRLEKEAVRAMIIFAGVFLFSIMLILSDFAYSTHIAYTFVSIGLFYTLGVVYRYDLEKEKFDNKKSYEELMNWHLRDTTKREIIMSSVMLVCFFCIFMGLNVSAICFLCSFTFFNTLPFIIPLFVGVLIGGAIFSLFFFKSIKKILVDLRRNIVHLNYLESKKGETEQKAE